MKNDYSSCRYFLYICLISSLLTLPNFSFGTHGMGADITYRCIGPNQYEVTLTFFRDCIGITPEPNETVNLSSAMCNYNAEIQLTKETTIIDVTPVCPTETSNCTGLRGVFGVEQHQYTSVLNLPPGCGNDWVIGWEQCCRNFGITTLANPGNLDVYISARLDNTVSPCNSSPEFTNLPTPIVCSGELVVYNHGATDPDGDSLVYSLANCQTTFTSNTVVTPIPVPYITGFSSTQPLTTTADGVVLDPATGEIRFTPVGAQIGVICVKVDEFRNGVKIGETIRDMQFSVRDCSNAAPTASGIDGTADYKITICAGTQTCFNINGIDPNGDNVTLSWNEGISDGTFTVVDNGTRNPSATFCWDTELTDLGSHFFTVKAEDDACPITASGIYSYEVEVVETLNSIGAGPDTTICPGGSVMLIADSGADSYSWFPAIGLSDPNIQNPIATPSASTIYTVTASFPDGCNATDIVRVNVSTPPALSVDPNTKFICPGNSAILSVNTAATNTISWSNGETTPSVNVSPSSDSVFTVTVTDTLGCENSTTATVRVNEPATSACIVIYASPDGTGDGTISNPASLPDAVQMASCSDMVLRLATGFYVTDATLNITSGITIEGGFDPSNSWRKTSLAGATTIRRSNTAPEGPADALRLVAFSVSNATGFRFQDLTIETEDATTPGTSTYGMYMENCTNYELVRCQILPGNAANGIAGNPSVDVPQDGGDGIEGLAGQSEVRTGRQHGAIGGVGGGGNGGLGGTDGTNGCTQPSGNNNVGCQGENGQASGDFWSGGGGGAGGGGGQGRRDGGAGGSGGAVFSDAGNPCALVTSQNNLAGVGIDCRQVGNWAGQENGCYNFGFLGPLDRTDGQSGRCGNDGNDGCDGIDGIAGTAGFHLNFFNPGPPAGSGGRGYGGQGGSGGGGGAGEGPVFGTCVDPQGSGASGGGGGGGGEGGYGGGGGSGGGGSFGLYLNASNTGASIIDCFIEAGSFGLGGDGADGTAGGLGGAGGSGGVPDFEEVGLGGNGGNGGNGGRGGQGGQGAIGEALAIYPAGSVTYTAFDLAAQPEIFMDNVSCVNTDVNYSGTTAEIWDLGTNSTPRNPNGASVTAQYTDIGRQTIRYASDIYTDFANIILPENIIPLATAIPAPSNDTITICAGESVDFSALNGGLGYIYNWDLANATAVSNYNGAEFQSLSGIQFDTPGVYPIQLQYETDCCGLTQPDTLMLRVAEAPILALSPDTSICAGSGGVNLTVSGGDTYVWSPSLGLNMTSGDSVMASPSTSTTYIVTSVDATGQCSATDSVNVSVNELQLAISPNDAMCGPDGSITANVTEGSGDYSYNWNTNPGQSNATATGLLPGSYQVTVVDNITGCEGTDAGFVNAIPSNLLASLANLSPVSCVNDTDGEASISIISGDPQNVVYEWLPNTILSTDSFANNLPADTMITVIVTDTATGCISEVSFEVPEPSPVVAAILDTPFVDRSCTSFGTLQANASGGDGPYFYEWVDLDQNVILDTNALLTGMQNCGQLMLVTTDQKGCKDSLNYAFATNESPILLDSSRVVDASGCLATDGEADLFAIGCGDLTYEWVPDNNFVYDTINGPRTGPSQTGLAPGTFTVTITSTNGCSIVEGVVIADCPLFPTLLTFEAEGKSNYIHTFWDIETYQLLSHFELERSLDAENFVRIAEVDWSEATHYEFDDPDVVPYTSYYYRLRQVGVDGDFVYSDIREASIIGDGIRVVQAFPNPTKDWLSLEVQSPNSSNLKILLYNNLGQEMGALEFAIEVGDNKLQIDMRTFASGTYWARVVVSGIEVEPLKLVKE